jgi:hypothetical protein
MKKSVEFRACSNEVPVRVFSSVLFQSQLARNYNLTGIEKGQSSTHEVCFGPRLYPDLIGSFMIQIRIGNSDPDSDPDGEFVSGFRSGLGIRIQMRKNVEILFLQRSYVCRAY